MNTAALEQTIQRVIASGPFAETWESFKGYTVPAWYEDGKFGIFTDAMKPDFTSQDIRFTTRSETLYAAFLAWPENGSVVITSLTEKTGLYPLRS